MNIFGTQAQAVETFMAEVREAQRVKGRLLIRKGSSGIRSDTLAFFEKAAEETLTDLRDTDITPGDIVALAESFASTSSSSWH